MSFNANRLIAVGRILAIANIIGAIVVCLSIIWVTRVAGHLAHLQDRHRTDYALGDQLHQSSDGLTRLARTFAATGDLTFEQQYLRLLAIRNGEAPRPEGYQNVYWDFVSAGLLTPPDKGEAVSIDELLLPADFTATEYALLNESHAASDALVALETQAMNAVKEVFQAADGSYSIQREPDREFAVRLLHSAEYHILKLAL